MEKTNSQSSVATTGDLKNKVVVITGGTRGIGLSIAQACAAAGAHVVVSGRKPIEAKGLHFVRADVTKSNDLQNLFSEAQKLGPVYGVICAAGIYGAIGPFRSCSIEEWIEGLEINLIGVARTIHAALPTMKGEGRIILFSGGGQAGMPNFSSYVTGKGAIWRMTETLGLELGKENIQVNAIMPGAVNTQFLDDLLKAGPDKVGDEFYKKALAQKKDGGTPPQKAVDLCLFLLSPKAKGLSGRTLSAVWDDYKTLAPQDIQATDLYQFRRVIDSRGGTRS